MIGKHRTRHRRSTSSRRRASIARANPCGTCIAERERKIAMTIRAKPIQSDASEKGALPHRSLGPSIANKVRQVSPHSIPRADRSARSFHRTFSFGPFRLLPTQRLLFEGDQPVRLRSRALGILLALGPETRRAGQQAGAYRAGLARPRRG